MAILAFNMSPVMTQQHKEAGLSNELGAKTRAIDLYCQRPASESRKAANKRAEKDRRDRLKGAVDKLAELMGEPCCGRDHSFQQVPATRVSPVDLNAKVVFGEKQANSKVETIEDSLQYIICLKDEVKRLATNNEEGMTRTTPHPEDGAAPARDIQVSTTN
ncbi:hypothetical protein B0T16DRAFT_394282 [Cercophora newfieldiana]|uniref:BHLH domain-containing protein n=1 Tax=Cercophora newfieldiana TaxID=92897 RepID=A0AA39XZC9_9PEZI|nr:hypothetical protein B0T16DRAFT_394282 [Cercophora newfieldiana]